MTIIKALSIRQPWASLIACGAKDIENRPRRLGYRGPLLIHAGVREPDGAVLAYVRQRYRIEGPREPRGGIVGIATLIDCVEASDSPWFEGPFGLVLRRARELAFRPMLGMLPLFTPPPEILAAYADELRDYQPIAAEAITAGLQGPEGEST